MQFLLDKRFNQIRQVWYLANGVKVENPVYILSNEMLKFIYIHMKLLYKYFALFEIIINLFCIVYRFFTALWSQCHSFFGKRSQ